MNISSTAGNSLLNILDSSNTKKSKRNSQMNAIFQASIAARRQSISDLLSEKFKISTETDTAAYKTVSSDAKTLQKAIETLATDGEETLYNEAENTGDNSKVYAKVKAFITAYNTLKTDTDKLGGTIHNVYGANLDTCLKNYATELEKIGVSVSDNDSLALDEEVLQKSSLSDIQCLFSTNDSFASKVKDILSDMTEVVDQAVDIKEAMGATYNKSGSIASSILSSSFDSIG